MKKDDGSCECRSVDRRDDRLPESGSHCWLRDNRERRWIDLNANETTVDRRSPMPIARRVLSGTEPRVADPTEREHRTGSGAKELHKGYSSRGFVREVLQVDEARIQKD